MPNANASDGNLSSRVIREDDSYAWRERVWRFRRGWLRIVRGFSEVGRGVGDIVVAAPAAIAVGAMLGAMQLYRRVGLLRVFFDLIVHLHGVFIRVAWRVIARTVGRSLRVLFLITTIVGVVMSATPALDGVVEFIEETRGEIADIADRRAARDDGEVDRDRQRPPAMFNPPAISTDDIGAMASRAAYGVALIIAILSVVVATCVVVAYIGFALYNIGRAVVRVAAWFAAPLIEFLRAIVRAGRGAARLTDRGLDGLASVIAIGLRRLIFGVAYIFAWIALRLLRVSRAGAVISMRQVGYGAMATRGGAFILGRFIWRHVFRIFALTGSIAALSVTYWALKSAQEGRPFPQALADIAGPTAVIFTATLVAMSLLAVLAGVALAVRHAPPRLLRMLGLAALVLLLLAPLPFAALWIWNTGVIQTGLARIATAGVAIADNAQTIMSVLGLAGLTLAAVILVWVAARLFWRVSRQISPQLLGRIIAGAVVLAAAGVAALGLVSWVSTGALESAGQAIEVGVRQSVQSTARWIELAAPIAAKAALGLIAAAVLAAASIVAWRILRSVPAAGWRRAAMMASVLILITGVGAMGFLVWRSGAPQSVYLATLERIRSLELGSGGTIEDDADAPIIARNETAEMAELEPGTLTPVAPPPSSIAQLQTTPLGLAEVEPVAQDESSGGDQAVELGMPDEITVFPPRPMHWRFGSAELVGDGLTAFERIMEAELGPVDAICAFDALMVVGAASSEGAPLVNAALAQCRAHAAAERVAVITNACSRSRPDVYLADLGAHSAARSAPGQRPLVILGLDWSGSAPLRSEIDERVRASAGEMIAAGVDVSRYGALRIQGFARAQTPDNCAAFEQ